MSNETSKPKRVRSGRLRREIPAAMVEHRGKRRCVVAEIDPSQGKISVRLYGCRKRKTYTFADLYVWGQQLSLL